MKSRLRGNRMAEFRRRVAYMVARTRQKHRGNAHSSSDQRRPRFSTCNTNLYPNGDGSVSKWRQSPRTTVEWTGNINHETAPTTGYPRPRFLHPCRRNPGLRGLIPGNPRPDVCFEEVHALIELLDGAAVRQQRRRGGWQFEVLEDLVNDVRVGKEGQHDHRDVAFGARQTAASSLEFVPLHHELDGPWGKLGGKEGPACRKRDHESRHGIG